MTAIIILNIVVVVITVAIITLVAKVKPCDEDLGHLAQHEKDFVVKAASAFPGEIEKLGRHPGDSKVQSVMDFLNTPYPYRQKTEHQTEMSDEDMNALVVISALVDVLHGIIFYSRLYIEEGCDCSKLEQARDAIFPQITMLNGFTNSNNSSLGHGVSGIVASVGEDYQREIDIVRVSIAKKVFTQ